ncbi:MAG: TolB family protein [Anaerolineaceae bacterium]
MPAGVLCLPFSGDQTLELSFMQGQVGQDGGSLRMEYLWRMDIRPPEVIVTRALPSGQELFAIPLDGGSPGWQLTRAGGQVYNYKASPDGEQIAFSVMNQAKGMDLWFVNRDGSGQKKVLDCGTDRCTTPAWSPDMKEIVYTRQNAGLDPNGPLGAPRTWLFDVLNGQTTPFFSDPQVIGYGANWSPDGRWLSIWNGSEGGIQIVNRETAETYVLESPRGDTGSWSADSHSLFFSDMIIGDTSYHDVVLKADILTQSVTTVLGKNTTGGGYSINNPIVNPGDGWVAVAVQPNVKIPGRMLVLMNPDTNEEVKISSDLSSIPSFLSWTPDGRYLLYQLDYLSGKEDSVEIWQWERATGLSTLVSKGDRWPQWLP